MPYLPYAGAAGRAGGISGAESAARIGLPAPAANFFLMDQIGHSF